MKEKIEQLQQQIEAAGAATPEELEAFRLKYLSKKGEINRLFEEFKTIPKEERKEVGRLMNDLKNAAQKKYDALQEQLAAAEDSGGSSRDLTLPVNQLELGSRHPISIVRNEITDIFARIGFTVAEGPEIEDDWHNFSALNFPEEHPARDMQDTFFVGKDPDIALRTHTSSVQVRVMESSTLPVRIIAPGRVFRNEAISARAHCIFHQI